MSTQMSARAPHQHDGSAPHRLGTGRNGLEREQVSHIQRARMLTAMAEVCAEHGAGNVTVAHVVERAGVSRRTFYEVFSDAEDCLLRAFEEGVERASERVLPAYRAEGRWRERIRASLQALLQFLDEEPFLARLLIVESLGGGHMLARRSRVVARLVAVVDGARAEAKASPEATMLTAEGVVGAVLSVIHGRMLERDPGRLIGLLNPLMSMVVMPYLGPFAARRELSRPVARTAGRVPVVPSSPLRGLGMRVTYRTVRALEAIAAAPGSSNRRIGESSGMSDQGQVSKLLARLERLGLIENAGARSGRGEPNAWTLTRRGEEVHGAIAQRAAHV
jgi:AcrR family transcriptional regulator